MQLRDIVSINQQGLVADAVNLNMLADRDKNLKLCSGFVFNYNSDRPKHSTLGVLRALCDSFHSANNPNVHLMVQDFGKGKSHFALTVANFFQQPADSPEVEGILEQINFLIPANQQAIYEYLEAYKDRTKPYLVLCISGEVNTDLGKAVIQALQTSLEAHGIGDSLAQHFIQDPLNYLQELANSQPNRARAEDYLSSQENFEGDLASLLEDLKAGDYQLIPIVKDLSAVFNNGRSLDFQLTLDLEAMLKDVIEKHCTGKQKTFEGILILFDELNAYLRNWLANPRVAGGAALQNLTNACANHRGKLALLCLAQVQPSVDTQVPQYDRQNYSNPT